MYPPGFCRVLLAAREAVTVTNRKNKRSTLPAEADWSIPATDGLFEVALDIARKETEMLVRMRAALEAGDDKEALRWARKLCGLSD